MKGLAVSPRRGVFNLYKCCRNNSAGLSHHIDFSENQNLNPWLPEVEYFLADRTNGRAYATVLRPSQLVCLTVSVTLYIVA